MTEVISNYLVPECSDLNSVEDFKIYMDNQISISSNAMSMDECQRDFEMVYGKRPEAHWALTPFRGHRGLGLFHFIQQFKVYRKTKKSYKNI